MIISFTGIIRNVSFFSKEKRKITLQKKEYKPTKMTLPNFQQSRHKRKEQTLQKKGSPITYDKKMEEHTTQKHANLEIPNFIQQYDDESIKERVSYLTWD